MVSLTIEVADGDCPDPYDRPKFAGGAAVGRLKQHL